MKSTICGALVSVVLLHPGSVSAAMARVDNSNPTAIWSGTWSGTPFAGARQFETVVLEVSGLWSTFCERYLEQALVEPLEGVDRVEANHEEDKVTVSYDPERLTPEEIAAVIEDCPFFDVTGSATHSLNQVEIERHRGCWCCLASRDKGEARTRDRSS